LNGSVLVKSKNSYNSIYYKSSEGIIINTLEIVIVILILV